MIKRQYIYLALVMVSFFWGTSFTAAKIGLCELTPMNLAAFRFILASLIFAAILFIKKLPSIEYKDIPLYIILGFMVITSYFYIQYTALRNTTTINSALIVAVSPIFTVLFGLALKLENVSFIKIIGIVLAFFGVSLIITNGEFVDIFKSDTIISDLMLLFNAIVWAGFTLYGKKIMKKYSPFVVMAYVHIFGTLMLLPITLIPNQLEPIPLYTQLGSIGWTTIIAALYLAIFSSVYAYYVWYIGVELLGAVRTAVFSYLNPLFTVIAGVLLLSEQVTVYIIIGGLLVLTGIYLTNRPTINR